MADAHGSMEGHSGGSSTPHSGEKEFFTPPGSSANDNPLNEAKHGYFPYNEEKTLQHVSFCARRFVLLT